MTVMLDRAISDVRHEARDTISGLIVPWGTDNEVVDRVGNRVEHYIETWQRGAFAGQDRSGNVGTLRKIEFVDGHTDNRVGYALELSDDDDGERGLFRIKPQFVDDIHQMIEDGIDALSARFIPKPGGVQVSGMVGKLERRVRSAAHMVHVALVPEPALVGSGVNRNGEPSLLDEVRAAEAAEVRNLEASKILAEIESVADRWAHLSH